MRRRHHALHPKNREKSLIIPQKIGGAAMAAVDTNKIIWLDNQLLQLVELFDLSADFMS